MSLKGEVSQRPPVKSEKSESTKKAEMKEERRGSDDHIKSGSASSTEQSRARDDKDSKSLTDLETDSSASAPSVSPRKNPSSTTENVNKEKHSSPQPKKSSSFSSKEKPKKPSGKSPAVDATKSESKKAVDLSVSSSKSKVGEAEAKSASSSFAGEGGRGLAALMKSSVKEEKSDEAAAKRKLIVESVSKIVTKEYPPSQQKSPAKDQKPTSVEPDIKKSAENLVSDGDGKKSTKPAVAKKSVDSAAESEAASVKAKARPASVAAEDTSAKKKPKPKPKPPKIFSDTSSDESDAPLHQKEKEPPAKPPVLVPTPSKNAETENKVTLFFLLIFFSGLLKHSQKILFRYLQTLLIFLNQTDFPPDFDSECKIFDFV